MAQPDDFVSEFFQQLERVVSDWAQSLGSHTHFGGADLRNPLEGLVNYAHFPKRDEYCRLRYQGLTPQSALSHVVDLPLPHNAQGSGAPTPASQAIIARWKEMLSPLEGQPVYYAHIPRMIEYLLPFISADTRNVVLVTECNITPGMFDLPDNVTLVKFVDSGCRLYSNSFLESNFPVLCSFANTIALLDQCIKPSEFACICGCNIPAKIWATICAARGAKSVCYQHGWPAFIHAPFKNMPFDRMVTWGPRFETLWRSHNPAMEFIPGKYPYPVKQGAHNRITFFLQQPYYIATERTQEQMVDLINQCAVAYPDIIVQYRSHPDTRLDSHTTKLFSDKPNIIDVSSHPLDEVYASTRVAVAHFSSTIMECIAHGCCPLVFNPSPSWNYYPDLSALGLGFISTDFTSFFNLLPLALDFHVAENLKKQWFG